MPVIHENPADPNELNSLPERFLRLGSVGAPICRRASKVYKISGEREYALKCIPFGEDEASFRQAKNEKEIMLALTSCPGAVQLLDCEVVQNGERSAVYLLENWLTPLRRWLKENRLSLQKSLLLIADVCKALSAIHHRGVLHLDVKPGNLFVDLNGRVLIGDFGVSMFTREACQNRVRCGTLSYIAPEMYRLGEAQPASDVYGVGMMLYELLSGGQLPFEAEGDRDKAAYKRLAGEALPVIKMADKNLQDKLNALIQRACAYDLYARFASADEMQNALEKLICQLDETALQQEKAPWHGAAICADDSMHVTRFVSLQSGSVPDQPLAEWDDRILYGSPSDEASVRIVPESQDPDESFDQTFPTAREDEASFQVLQSAGDFMESAPFPGDDIWQDADEDAFSLARGNAGDRPSSDPFWDEDSVKPQSPGLAPRFCSMCGQRLGAGMRFCPGCGSPIQQGGLQMPSSMQQTSRVQFSALAPKAFLKGQYTIVHVLMYEQEYRREVDELIASFDVPVQETKSGFAKVREGAEVKIVLSSPDVEIEEAEAAQLWQSGYLNFNFGVKLLEDFAKPSILLKAQVYADGLLITRLQFTAQCTSAYAQKLEALRKDVLSVFLSYSSEDRPTVMTIARVMSAIYGRENVFIDVDKLRMGEDWWERITNEIDRRDVLYLCWSQNAMKSEYVDKEWNYAFDCKGEEGVEPFSMEPPELCPVPEKLKHKHFNDGLLYMQKGIEAYALEKKAREQKDAT